MFFERLVNSGNVPVLEQTLKFTAARHKLLAENVANIDTPYYQQKDLDPVKFQAELQQRIDERTIGQMGGKMVRFDDIQSEIESPKSQLFHDGNNRSVEQLMTNISRNALMHNMCVELLRKQYAAIEMALKERVA